VEAKSSSLTDLMAAVDYARKQAGVTTVSMSWGSSEFFGEQWLDSHFTTPAGHAGVTFVAASGDDGTTSWPATSSKVLAVGGTRLSTDSAGNYLGETAWSGSGGGVSFIEGTYGPDVAYDADPSSGFAVYDSVPYNGTSGWQTVGGTSAGAPQWAALVAIADQGRALSKRGSLTGTQTLNAIYSAPSADFHDITVGFNDFYYAMPGYDLVTGRGSPVADKIVSYLASYTGTSSSATSTATVASNVVTNALTGSSPIGSSAGSSMFADAPSSTLAQEVAASDAGLDLGSVVTSAGHSHEGLFSEFLI
jgi:subtilase family serine protease